MTKKKKPLKDTCHKWWSKIIRNRGKCQRCKRTGIILHAHHIKCKNRYERLRFELKNGMALCPDCHRWAHADPLQFAEFVKKEEPENYEFLKDENRHSGSALTYKGLVEKRKELKELYETLY
jgi:hypothetical protein